MLVQVALRDSGLTSFSNLFMWLENTSDEWWTDEKKERMNSMEPGELMRNMNILYYACVRACVRECTRVCQSSQILWCFLYGLAQAQ